MPDTNVRSRSPRSAACDCRCGTASERSRRRRDRRSGAARARPRAEPRRDRLVRDPEADRRPDRDETRDERRRDRGESGGRARPRGDRRGGGAESSLSVQAAGAAHRDRQSHHRAARRRDDRDQRGLPLRAGPPRQPPPAPLRPGSLPRPRGQRARGGQARVDRRHLPARGRSPRRHPVRRPRRSTDVRDLGAVRPSSARRVRSPRRTAHPRGSMSTGQAGTLWCELAWLGRERAEGGVLLELDGERIASVTAGVKSPPDGATPLAGLTIPGMANAHSHAFQRALRGRTQAGRGDFWTWRSGMYALAERIDPDSYLALARATFAEMALAGITSVGEFHYLHHCLDGTPYDDPNALGNAVIAGAREAGIRITLLDTCYLHGGVGREPEGVQLRFSDGSAEAWAKRVAAIQPGDGARVGAAIHSVRAVDPAA